MLAVENTLVVLRTSGERTTETALAALAPLFPSENICLVRTRPFFEAVLDTLRSGAEHSADFLLALDADVIPDANILETVSGVLERIDLNRMLHVVFRCRDRFLGKGIRDAGNHVYMNWWSSDLLRFLEREGDPSIHRPESDNLRAFAEKNGLSTTIASETIVGSHGFSQYYTNIYYSIRNLCVKAVEQSKHALLGNLEMKVKKFPDDMDLAVALEGAKAGLKEDRVVLDFEEYAPPLHVFSRLGIVEKQPISDVKAFLEDFRVRILQFNPELPWTFN